MANPGYVTNPNKWKITYTIEYVDDKRIWQLLCDEKVENPWEVYKRREFDNASEAMHLYTLWVLQDNIYDVKLFARYETESGEWYEEYIDYKSTFRYDVRNRVDMEMRKEIEKLHEENSNLVKENTAMIKFLKDRHVDVYSIINEEV